MKDNKIVDINATPIAPVSVVDNTYDNLQQVLLDGKTIKDVTDKQLIYLITVDGPKLQAEMNLLIHVFIARVSGQEDLVPDEDDKATITS